MHKIAVIASKGGTGKTTTAINFAHAAALMGHKVLLIDSDSQGSASLAFELNGVQGLSDLLLCDKVDIYNVRNNLYLVGSGRSDIFLVERYLAQQAESEYPLAEALSRFTGVDIIILDCSPSINIINSNILNYVDNVLVPVSMDYFALEGAALTLKLIREMEKKNLGTKATRSQIIDILFKRGYLEGKSIEVTPLGLSVVDTLERYCPNVLSEKLTRKFESEMEQIESGKLDSESVIAEGREVIVEITDEFKKKESEIGFDLAKSFRSSGCVDSLGPCLKCDGSLVLRKSKYGGFFVGCSNYPQCSFKISIPKGGVRKSGECNKCGYAVLTLTSAKKPFSFCINPNCKG